MFHSARLQLTAWYLLIIMIISGLFSVVIYTSFNAELTRIEHFQQDRQRRWERRLEDMPIPVPRRPEPIIDPREIEGARERLILTLLFINAGILLVSGGAGYFLAGRTLRPIQETLQEQRRFISDASHELRTPLTSLRTELEVSLRDTKLSLADAKKLLESNLEEVIHLQSLSDGLLSLARHQSTLQKSFTEISLVSCVEEALKKVSPLAQQKHIAIMQKVEPTEILGDKQALVELLIILLDNAIKYSPPKATVIMRGKKMAKWVVIEVRDSGIGIDKEDMPHIFDRFYRADKARTHSDSSGYGLGLSIAKKIVEDHGGTITAQSKKGSTFTVRLPL